MNCCWCGHPVNSLDTMHSGCRRTSEEISALRAHVNAVEEFAKGVVRDAMVETQRALTAPLMAPTMPEALKQELAQLIAAEIAKHGGAA